MDPGLREDDADLAGAQGLTRAGRRAAHPPGDAAQTGGEVEQSKPDALARLGPGGERDQRGRRTSGTGGSDDPSGPLESPHGGKAGGERAKARRPATPVVSRRGG